MIISALLTFAITMSAIGVAIFTVINLVVRVSGWSKAFHKVAKRYHAAVSFSGNKPRMTFNYGETPAILSYVGSRHPQNRRMQLTLKWPNRRVKFFVSSLGEPVGLFMHWRLSKVDCQNWLKSNFYVAANKSETVEQLINQTTAWHIEQLAKLDKGSGVEISIIHGKMRIGKPGYIKDEMLIDDFLRLGLQLSDQLQLASSGDIQFVSDDCAVVIDDVVCPICCEQINENLVTCIRCKTPHCSECWEYNGQCATFACNETRFARSDGQAASASH